MADYANAQFLVSADWLAEHLNDSGACIVDAARGAGRYAEGHLPGAVNLPVARLDDPAASVRSTLLPAERFSTLVGNLGIGSDDPVVIYDDGPGLMAARTFWALEYHGHQKLAVLDGGIAKWAAEGKPLSTEAASPQPKQYTATVHPERGATKESVKGQIEQAGVAILDVRSLDEYTGAVVNAFKGGHIPERSTWNGPDALNPAAGVIKRGGSDDAVRGGRRHPRQRGDHLLSRRVRAAHSYYVLRLLGYDKVSNYTGSWGDWGTTRRGRWSRVAKRLEAKQSAV